MSRIFFSGSDMSYQIFQNQLSYISTLWIAGDSTVVLTPDVCYLDC